MPDELLTITLTVRQARALHSCASMFSRMLAEENPEWDACLEDDGPPALTSGILALETCLMLAVES